MNSDNFLIEELDIEQAQNICQNIDEPVIRQKAVATALAAKLATKYFGNEYNVDIESGLHNITELFPELEISDVYINENYIDVRLFFNENELAVPKTHFDNAITPVAYMFIKLDETVSGGLVVGFILPENISTEIDVNGYYPVQETDLVSFFEIEPLLANTPNIELPDNSDKAIYEFLDKHINDPEAFYNILTKSKDTRKKLIKSFNAQSTFKYISITEPDAEISTSTEESLIENTFETEDLTLTDNEIEDTFAINETVNEEPLTEELEEQDKSFENLPENFELIENVAEDFDIIENDVDLTEGPVELGSDTDLELIEDDSLENDLVDNEEDFSTMTTPSLSSFEDDDLGTPFEEQDNNLILSDAEDDIMQFNEEDSIISLDEEDFDPTNANDEIIEVDMIEETTENDFEIQEINTAEYVDEQPLENEKESFDIIDKTNDIDDIETVEIQDYTGNTETLEIEESNTVETIEEEIEETNITSSSEEDLIIEDSTNEEVTYEEVVSEEITEDINPNNTDENLSVLFNNNENTEEATEEISEEFAEELPVRRKSSGIIPLLGIATIVACLGYYTFNQIRNNASTPAVTTKQNNIVATPQSSTSLEPQNKTTLPAKTEEAMPNETIENISNEVTEIGTAVSIPAIENNLDASVLVSNLKISWEVPAQYATSTVAKKYLTKLGKIIQLNLKSELLLVNKVPISNKIILELEMDTDGKLKLKDFINSSGEKSVDALIKQTVNKVLDINLSINTSSLASLKGNPRLVIRL